jgi:hypothetical protein
MTDSAHNDLKHIFRRKVMADLANDKHSRASATHGIDDKCVQVRNRVVELQGRLTDEALGITRYKLRARKEGVLEGKDNTNVPKTRTAPTSKEPK